MPSRRPRWSDAVDGVVSSAAVAPLPARSRQRSSWARAAAEIISTHADIVSPVASIIDSAGSSELPSEFLSPLGRPVERRSSQAPCDRKRRRRIAIRALQEENLAAYRGAQLDVAVVDHRPTVADTVETSLAVSDAVVVLDESPSPAVSQLCAVDLSAPDPVARLTATAWCDYVNRDSLREAAIPDMNRGFALHASHLFSDTKGKSLRTKAAELEHLNISVNGASKMKNGPSRALFV